MIAELGIIVPLEPSGSASVASEKMATGADPSL